MKILVATPAYGGNVKSRYAESLFALAQGLARSGIAAEFQTNQLSEVARARNVFGSIVAARKDLTHLLFLDADMAFHPDSVTRLIKADKPLVGHIYPRKSLVLERLIANARALRDNRAVIARSLDYNTTVDTSGAALRIDKGLVSVAGIGMGLCLIRRDVFDGLIASGQVLRHAPAIAQFFRPQLTGDFWGFFDNLVLEDGVYLSEDFSFCRRWIDACGGEVFGMVTDYVEHVGDMIYGAPYLYSLDE